MNNFIKIIVFAVVLLCIFYVLRYFLDIKSMTKNSKSNLAAIAISVKKDLSEGTMKSLTLYNAYKKDKCILIYQSPFSDEKTRNRFFDFMKKEADEKDFNKICGYDILQKQDGVILLFDKYRPSIFVEISTRSNSNAKDSGR